MALLFIDGFDAGDYATKWDFVDRLAATSAVTRFGTGMSLGSTNNSIQTAYKTIEASDCVTLGFALRRYQSASLSTTSFLSDGGSTYHITINIGSSGRVNVVRGSYSGTLIATGTTVLPYNRWFYIEIQVTVSDTIGSVEVRLNGSTTPEIKLTDIDTRNGGTNTAIDGISIGCQDTSIYSAGYFDDLYILNSSGETNNTFLGDVRVQTIVPNGTGESSQFTGSDGDSVDNYALLDELPFSVADYVKSNVVGERDMYTMSKLQNNTDSILGVQHTIIGTKTGAANNINIKPALSINGSIYYGDVHILPYTFKSLQKVHDNNPGTLSKWTVSDINSIETGMEVV